MRKSFRLLISSCLFLTNIYSHTLDIPPTDSSIALQYELPTGTYHKYCRNVYSQNGEDGILEQLLKELSITRGVFCEFGAADGLFSSNTYNLIENHSFSGMAIELNPSLYQKCVSNYRPFPNVQVFQGAVDYRDKNNDLNAWLERGNLPYDLDVLSIDIDSDDYYVWQGLTKFSPKIVIIETNSYRDPIFEELPNSASQEYTIDLLKAWCPIRVAMGSSFISILQLGLMKGYIPVAFTGNLTFVRKDLVYKLREFPYKISSDPYDYVTLYTHLAFWNNQWFTNTGLILNVAIRDYYLQFKKKHIDIQWINMRMKEILENINVVY